MMKKSSFKYQGGQGVKRSALFLQGDAMPGELRTRIDAETIISQLMKLIALCEQHGLDLDLLVNEAYSRVSGEPDVEESG
jgi:hypothetical protein